MDSNPWPKLKEILPKQYWCEVCERDMKYADHKSHLRGKLHKEKEAALKKSNGEADGFGTGAYEYFDGSTPAAAGGEGCFNCGETGHRKSECTKPRAAKPGSGPQCRNCDQYGHVSKECTEPRSAKNIECRNCKQTGHFSKDCTAPRPCRNCDGVGHQARECPKPKDWSRVKCNNCGQMGHTVKKCTEPVKEEASFDGGFETSNGFDAPQAAEGGWADAGVAPAGDWASSAEPAAESQW